MKLSEIHDLIKPLQHLWPKTLRWESGYPIIQVFNKGGEWEEVAIAQEHLELLLEGTFIRYLIGEGYLSFEWDYNSDTDEVILRMWNNEFKAKTGLACLVLAILEFGGRV